MDKIIYTQTHPKPDFEALAKELEAIDVPEDCLPTFDELMARRNRLRFEEIPGRRAKIELFMAAAKALCREYEYDLVIRETDHGVVAELSLDVSQYMDCRLKSLIGMADDMDLAKDIRDRDLTLFLRMNILAVYRGSTRIFPEFLDD